MRLHGGVVAGQDHALRPRVVHLTDLRGLRQIDEHRAGTAGVGDVVGLGEHARDVLRVGHQIRMLDHRVGGAYDVGLLEGIGADGVGADLAGDDHHRHGIHIRVGDRGQHIGCARAGGHDAHAHAAGGHGVSLGGVSGGLLMAHQQETELRIVLDRVVDGQNRAARDAEHILDPQILQRTDQRFGAGHLLAVCNGLFVGAGSGLGHAAERLQRCR